MAFPIVLVTLWLATPPQAASTASGAAGQSDPEQTGTQVGAEQAPPAASPRLKLGPYGNPSPPKQSLPDLPRFEEEIEVESQIPRDLNETMALWWKHFGFHEPAIYGRNYVTRRPPRPGASGSFDKVLQETMSADIVPVIEWLAKKVKEKKTKKVEPPPDPQS